MNKKCSRCGVVVKVERTLRNILDKKFMCGLCKIHIKEETPIIDLRKYCVECGFQLMDGEIIKCSICKIKAGVGE